MQAELDKELKLKLVNILTTMRKSLPPMNISSTGFITTTFFFRACHTAKGNGGPSTFVPLKSFFTVLPSFTCFRQAR